MSFFHKPWHKKKNGWSDIPFLTWPKWFVSTYIYFLTWYIPWHRRVNLNFIPPTNCLHLNPGRPVSLSPLIATNLLVFVTNNKHVKFKQALCKLKLKEKLQFICLQIVCRWFHHRPWWARHSMLSGQYIWSPPTTVILGEPNYSNKFHPNYKPKKNQWTSCLKNGFRHEFDYSRMILSCW